MIVFYRLPGVLAVLALGVYTVLTFALFKLFGVVLTLAGIAGFILSIGMAVDANVLIFARMKEELRAGRTLRNAIDAGFDHAWPSIRDSNASTIDHLPDPLCLRRHHRHVGRARASRSRC